MNEVLKYRVQCTSQTHAHIAGERCLRAGPKNGTNGFFIAVFIRKGMHTDSITSPQIAPTRVWKSDEGHKQKNEKKRKRRHKKGRKRTLPVTAC